MSHAQEQQRHDDTPGPAEHGTHTYADEHHSHLGKYMAVFAALCVLTGASFFTYSSYWPFDDHAAWFFMMFVSCVKASLVLLFFMHLIWEADWKYVLTIPATIMSIFLVLALVPDVGLRVSGFYPYSAERAEHVARPADREMLQHAAELQYGQGHHGDAEQHEGEAAH